MSNSKHDLKKKQKFGEKVSPKIYRKENNGNFKTEKYKTKRQKVTRWGQQLNRGNRK